MMGSAFRISASLVAGAAMLLLAQVAEAQDAAPAADGALAIDDTHESGLRTVRGDDGTIVVTARRYVPQGSQSASKTDIPLIQTPQSVSVVTRDQIDLLAFIDVQQAVRYTAGVFGENYGSDARYDFVTVRGFNPKQYVDGLAAPATSTINSVGLDLYAFQSLDILKGPSSVLYGNAPPGGLYNLVSRRASSRTEGELQVKYGSFDFRQIAGTVTGAATDWLDLRFTALYRDRDDVIDFLNAKRLLVAPTATVKIGSATRISPLVYYQYDRIDGGNGGFLPVIGTLIDNPANRGRLPRSINLGDPRNAFERRQWGAGYDAEHDFGGGISFRSNTKWTHYKEVQSFGLYNQGGYTNTTDPALPSYYDTISQSDFPNQEEVTSFATDNRLEAALETGTVRHTILAGVDYRNVLNVAGFGFNFGASTLDAYNPVYGGSRVTPTAPDQFGFNDQRLKQTGVYAQDQIALGRLYVTLGGRYDRVKIDNRATDDTTKQDKFTWRAGANLVLDSGIAPYVSYSTSFEPVLGQDTVTNQPFDPSTGHQWEGGIKYDARGLGPDVKLFGTAALFQIVQNNVVAAGNGNLLPLNGTQAGKVEVYGGEIELVARIREQLSINGSYSYTHSRVKESDVAVQIGAELPTTPKHKASLFVDYSFARGPLAGFGGGVGGRFTSRSAGALPSIDFTGALVAPIFADRATLFDAIVHYDLPSWRFAINGSNLFDRKYVARCSGVNGCFYGANRQILGTVTYRF